MIGCNYNYIKFMIRNKFVYSIIILFSLITMPLLSFGWDVGTFGGPYVSIPSAIQSNAIPARTSASGSFIYSPLLVSVTQEVHFALQLQLTHTTKSQYYGPLYWKNFTTIGGGAEFTLGLNKPIAFSLAFLYAMQIKDDERDWFGLGIIRSTFIIPIFFSEEQHRLMILFPIEIEVRDDYAGIRTGIGLRHSYNRGKR